jgi:hypothetical protein
MNLKPDHACNSLNTQWFYFRISNTRKDVKYTFHITNFIKPDSLFSNGMKPLIFSKREAELSDKSWVRAG